MAHSRIEEVVDDDEIADDPEEMDLDAFDFARPQHGSLQSSSSQPSVGGGGGGMTPDMIQAMMQQAQGSAGPPGNMQRHGQMSEQQRREAREATKKFQCIYPIYFDSTRSREDGRRVRKEDAVPNPLAWVWKRASPVQHSTRMQPSDQRSMGWDHPRVLSVNM